ncbi:distal tail protein Dit [Abyssicoccus albus]|uniref:Putative phage tail component-like protein n=1 Tax=Abyssicoccus albus TaxID=1817405 RepID=A0A3N5BY55_9BACL|nr:distal tail protein Dit [Abyssicoccus albus]RPF54728.1 putative phage tail component-like protein [Abyssicoccus albus]
MKYSFVEFGQKQQNEPLSLRLVIDGEVFDDIVSDETSSFITTGVIGRNQLSKSLTTSKPLAYNGELLTEQTLNPRELTVFGRVKGDSNESFNELMRRIKNKLYKEIVEISFTDERFIYYGTLSDIIEEEERSNNLPIQLKFICHDPFKYTPQKTFNYSNSSVLNIDSDYPVKANIGITYTEPVDEFTITNTSTNKVFRYKSDVANTKYEVMFPHNDVVDNLGASISSGGNENLLKDSNNFENYTAYTGYDRTITQNYAVEEWGTNDATRLTYVPNSNISKNPYSGLSTTPRIYGVGEEEMTFSYWVKNLGDKPFKFRYNGFSANNVWLQPGEQKRIISTGVNNVGTVSFQHQIYPESVGDTVDVALWRAKLEVGSQSTDWSVSPKDIEKSNSLTQYISLNSDLEDFTIDKSDQLVIRPVPNTINISYEGVFL